MGSHTANYCYLNSRRDGAMDPRAPMWSVLPQSQEDDRARDDGAMCARTKIRRIDRRGSSQRVREAVGVADAFAGSVRAHLGGRRPEGDEGITLEQLHDMLDTRIDILSAETVPCRCP